MAELSENSTIEELEARRDEIALEQAALTAEHRKLGVYLNAKRVVEKAERKQVGNIIETEAMEVESNG